MILQKGYNGNTPKRGRLTSNIQNSQGKQFRYAGRISLGSENFASLAKLHRDSEIEKFRYLQLISLASEISLA